MAESRLDVARGLLQEVENYPGLTVEEREIVEKEIFRTEHPLSIDELRALARFSHRQLARLRKGKLMRRDREIVEALMSLRKATPSGW